MATEHSPDQPIHPERSKLRTDSSPGVIKVSRRVQGFLDGQSLLTGRTPAHELAIAVERYSHHVFLQQARVDAERLRQDPEAWQAYQAERAIDEQHTPAEITLPSPAEKADREFP